MSINRLDLSLLQVLLGNGRDSIAELSRKTSLSREQVQYRMKKLEHDKVIKGYIAHIHQPIFCAGVATLLCKLTNTTRARTKEIIEFVKSHPNIHWIGELCGLYDIAFVFLYTDSENLAKTISDVTNYIGTNLKEQSLSIYISEYKFDRQPLLTHKTRESMPAIVSFNTPKITLDKKDILILKSLSTNARMKNSDLAKHIGLSEDAVRLRIKKLEENKVIRGYDTAIDEQKLGYEGYYIGLRIEQMNEKTIAKIRHYVNANPYIVYCVRTSGKYNLIINMQSKNRKHFIELLTEMRKTLEPELEDFEFQIILSVEKEVHVPYGMFKEIRK